MKLQIDLSSREEIAAAVPLLQLILAGTPEVAAPLAPPAPGTAVAAALPTAPVVMLATFPAPSVPLPPAMPAPMAAAPMAPAAPTTLASGVELDSTGLPWDERIHASTKTKLVSGEWKAKRGINDEALVKSIEAELRVLVDLSQFIPSPSDVPGQSNGDYSPRLPVPALDAAAIFGGAAPAPLAIAPQAAPSLPVPPVVPLASADPQTFEQIMPRISVAVAAGLLPPNAIQKACADSGLASVVSLQTSPQFVPFVWATLKQSYPALQ